MSLIPDKILTDEEISNFVKDANSNSDLIIGESKFKITPPDVPGSGLLIKLWIRQIEQGLSTYIAPIAAFKNVIFNSNPAKLIGELTSLINDVKSFFSDPLQAILDFTINKRISEESPFPIKLIHDESTGSQSGDLRNILEENAIRKLNGSSASGFSNQGYQYSVVSDVNGQVKIEKGLLILNSTDISKTTSIRISSETSDGKSTSEYLASLGIGEIVYVSVDSKRYPFVINYISSENNGFLLSVSRPDNASLDKIGGIEMSYITGYVLESENGSISSVFSMDPSSPRFNPALNSIKDFIIQDPEIGFVIKIPLSSVLSGIPLIDKISVRIGNFSDLAPENPTKIYIEKTEARSGIKFNDLLAALLSGRYPVLDFFKIAENEKFPGKNPKEDAQLEITGLAKLIEMSITDPLEFIQIIVGYIKLLLIPINFLLSVLETILSKITNPAKVIGLVIKVATNPIRFFCSLVSDSILEVLGPYVSPFLQGSNITYDEAKETQERGKIMGLKLLISEIVCGKFSKKFRDYIPNPGILNQITNTQMTSSDSQDFGSVETGQVSFAYKITFGDRSPDSGEIVFLSQEDSLTNTIRVSDIDSSMESPLSYMKTVIPGQDIKISIDGRDWEYIVISSTLNGSYFSFNVSLKKSPYEDISKEIKIDQNYLNSIESQTKSELLRKSIRSLNSQIKSLKDQIASGTSDLDIVGKKISDLESLKSSLEEEADLSVVSIKNPDLMYLFLVENYLPTKMVPAWESLKGILGLFLGTIVTFPSLLPAVFKSLFSGPSQEGSQAQTDLEASTGIIADLLLKMAEPQGILEQLNEESVVDENNEPRKSLREFIDLFLFSEDSEDLIDNSLLSIKSDVESVGFNLSVDGINVTYEDFVKRVKILIASYNALRSREEMVQDQIDRLNKLNIIISDIRSKINAAASQIEPIFEQNSLSGYREELEFYIYIRDVLQTQKFFSIWKSADAKYNYFKDQPIKMSPGLIFDFRVISGNLVDLYIENTLRSNPSSRITEEEPLRLSSFRKIILDDLVIASEILRNIK